jgi:para-nitrobenzyl esterase
MTHPLSRRGLIAASGAAGLAGALAWARPALAQAAPIVETAHGKVQGLVENGVKVFKGVRYGAYTGGPARFQPPSAPMPWAGVKDCTAYGASSPQMGGAGANPLTGGATRLETIGDEDCLFLNVWTPALDGARRPVMVWLHGGGFSTGSGSSPWYDGVNLARKQDVVLVTLNHRLSVAGYCALAELGGERFADSANVGMLDIVLALKWVKTNIERFGGDPGRVMIFGESGGGRKVSLMMGLEPGRGLFHRAVVESGSAIRVDSQTVGTERAQKLMQILGISRSEPDRLTSLPLDDLVRAAYQAQRSLGQFRPAVDGRSAKRHPFDPDASPLNRDVPMLIGTNRTEQSFGLGFLPGIASLDDAGLKQRVSASVPADQADAVIATYRRLFPAAKADELLYIIATDRSYFLDASLQAERKAAQNGAPAWMYGFYRHTPVEGGRLYTPHASEIAFVFDTLAKAPTIVGPATPEAQALSDKMSAAWAAFARTGKPSAPGLPDWPAYDGSRRTTMILDEGQCRLEDDPRSEQRRLMLAFGSQQMSPYEVGGPPGS